MRRILAMSVAAAVPAMLPAVAAGAQSRPVPPSLRTHHRLAHRPSAGYDPQREQPSTGAGASGDARAAGTGTGTGTGTTTTYPRIQLLRLGSPAPVTPAGAGSSAAPEPPTGAPGAGPGRVEESGQAHSPAQGEEGGPPTRLVLKTTMGSATPRTVTLLCDPPGGTHPKAAQACADLARSHGGFALRSGGRKPRACFMIYSPVTVSAKGRWRGEDVQFTARFPNTCVMRGQTGAIFDF